MNRNLCVTDIYADNRSRVVKNGITPPKKKQEKRRKYILFRVNRKRLNMPVITLNVNAPNNLIKKEIPYPIIIKPQCFLFRKGTNQNLSIHHL